MEHVAQGSLQSSFLEIFNARLDKVLSNWSDLLASPALSKGLDYATSSAPFKLFFFPIISINTQDLNKVLSYFLNEVLLITLPPQQFL